MPVVVCGNIPFIPNLYHMSCLAAHTYTIYTYISTTLIIHHLRSPLSTHPPSPLFSTSGGTQHWFLHNQHSQHHQRDFELEAEAEAAAAAVADAAMSSGANYSYGQPGHGGYGGGYGGGHGSGSGHGGMEPMERGGHRSMEGQGMGRGMTNGDGAVDWMGRSTHTMRSDEASSASSAASSVESRALVRRSPVPMSGRLNRGKLIDTHTHTPRGGGGDGGSVTQRDAA